jgi:hypothetical protein
MNIVSIVTAGLDPAISALVAASIEAAEGVDHRVKPGDGYEWWSRT